jgi:hypothetical protein
MKPSSPTHMYMDRQRPYSDLAVFPPPPPASPPIVSPDIEEYKQLVAENFKPCTHFLLSFLSQSSYRIFQSIFRFAIARRFYWYFRLLFSIILSPLKAGKRLTTITSLVGRVGGKGVGGAIYITVVFLKIEKWPRSPFSIGSPEGPIL